MGAGVVSYTPGPGDAETWPPFAGHPHDPRTPDGDDDDTTAESIAVVRDLLIAAEEFAKRGLMIAARLALVEAKNNLEELVGAE